MDDDLRKIPTFVRLSRATAQVLMQNIVLALGIKAVFLVLTFTGHATMWMAVFADMGASLQLCIVLSVNSVLPVACWAGSVGA
jgi:Cd2+/Zn2+-exporting ATPase